MTSKEVPHYRKTLGPVDGSARELLEKYSQIPPDQIEGHILRLRDLAWDTFPYPCVGSFLFLDISIDRTAAYPQVLERVKEGQKLLDIGCCFAQVARRLVYDGAPAENIWSSDLHAGFIDLGFDLFRDKDTLKSHFLAADVFDPQSPLEQLHQTFDIIHANSFFHLFIWEDQVAAATQLVGLLKPVKGSMILGKQVGSPTADTEPINLGSAGIVWRQNVASLTRLWEEVGHQTGSKWQVIASLDQVEASNRSWLGPTTYWLAFVIERLE